jgi:pentatricopeptide repeat protein
LEKLDALAVQCDTILFNSVISACGKSGQWQIALELMQLTLHQAKVFRENDSITKRTPHIESLGGKGI